MTYLNTCGFYYDTNKQLYFDRDLVQMVSYTWNLIDNSESKIVLTNYANQPFFVTPKEFVTNFVKVDKYLVTKQLNLKYLNSGNYSFAEPCKSTTIIAINESLVLLHVTYLGQLVFYYKPLGHVTLSQEEANLHLNLKKA